MGRGTDSQDNKSSEEKTYPFEIPRISVGVEGIDGMITGGVPDSSLMTVIGPPGSGKTTLGLQFLNRGLQNGENTLFISFEETPNRIVRSSKLRGFDFENHIDLGELSIIHIEPIEILRSLKVIREELPQIIREFDTDRVVVDSISLVETMYNDDANRRSEIYDLVRAMNDIGVTTLLTSEIGEDPSARNLSKYGFIEYLVDAVFVLRSAFTESGKVYYFSIEKIRDTEHGTDLHPYEITQDGLEVYHQAAGFSMMERGF